MNNAVYGKTMENMRQRIKIRVVNHKIYGKKLVAIHENKTCLTLSKPVCIWFYCTRTK